MAPCFFCAWLLLVSSGAQDSFEMVQSSLTGSELEQLAPIRRARFNDWVGDGVDVNLLQTGLVVDIETQGQGFRGKDVHHDSNSTSPAALVKQEADPHVEVIHEDDVLANEAKEFTVGLAPEDIPSLARGLAMSIYRAWPTGELDSEALSSYVKEEFLGEGSGPEGLASGRGGRGESSRDRRIIRVNQSRALILGMEKFSVGLGFHSLERGDLVYKGCKSLSFSARQGPFCNSAWMEEFLVQNMLSLLAKRFEEATSENSSDKLAIRLYYAAPSYVEWDCALYGKYDQDKPSKRISGYAGLLEDMIPGRFMHPMWSSDISEELGAAAEVGERADERIVAFNAWAAKNFDVRIWDTQGGVAWGDTINGTRSINVFLTDGLVSPVSRGRNVEISESLLPLARTVEILNQLSMALPRGAERAQQTTIKGRASSFDNSTDGDASPS